MTLARTLTVLFAKDHLLRRIVQKYRDQNMPLVPLLILLSIFMQHILYPHLSSTHVQTLHGIAWRSCLLLLGQLLG